MSHTSTDEQESTSLQVKMLKDQLKTHNFLKDKFKDRLKTLFPNCNKRSKIKVTLSVYADQNLNVLPSDEVS